MKASFVARAFSAFLALQFLNVQIQSAFGTEATRTADPAVVQALRQAEQKLGERLSRYSEIQAVRLAYRVYKWDVRLRNKVYKKSEREIQARIASLQQNGPVNEALEEGDVELGQEMRNEAAISDLNSFAAVTPQVSKAQANREQLLQNTDPLLLSLGSVVTESGKLSRASLEEFQSKLFQVQQTGELRAPAASAIVKIILTLLIVAVGLASLFVLFAILSFAATYGGVTVLGTVFIILLAAGVITGMYFTLRAIFSSQGRDGRKFATS